MTEINKKIDLGFEAHQKGDFETALNYYEEVLKSEPENAETISLKGSVLSLQGDYEQAEILLKHAVEIEPHTEGFWLNFADHYIRRQEPAVACRLLTENIASDSQYTPVWQCLYQAAMQANEPEFAILGLERSLAAEYNFKTLISLSQLLVRQKFIDKAIQIFNQYRPLAEKERTYWFALCWLLDSSRSWQVLLETGNQWLAKFKDDKDAYRYLASSHFELGKQHDAIALYEYLLEMPVNSAQEQQKQSEDLVNYAELCVSSLELDKAERALNKAEKAQIVTPGLFNAKVQLAIFKGQGKEAIALCEQCLSQFPEYFPIYTQFARITPQNITVSQIKLLQDHINESGRYADSMAFVLGHHYHATKDFQQAFVFYGQANQIRADRNAEKGAVYSTESADHFYDAVVSSYEALKGSVSFKDVDDAHSPIFIIGMPRSGTTLLEGLLATHSDLVKTGERIEFPNLLHKLTSGSVAQEDALEALTRFREDFIASSESEQTSPYFIDKNPSNYMAVGLITLLFPKAIIINLEREPIETIISIFRHEFSHMWSFATSLPDTAHQYAIYKKFIEYWRGQNPNLLTIQYEELVENPQRVVQTLLNSLGLELADDDFESALENQYFTTFSALQVRDKITNHNGQAQNYAEFIAGLNLSGI